MKSHRVRATGAGLRRAFVAGAVLVLGVSAGSFAGEPTPEEALAQRIHEATRRGAKAIAATAVARWNPAHTADRPGLPAAAPAVQMSDAETTLVALALLRAGESDEKKVASQLLDEWWQKATATQPDGNYQLALAVSALEGTALERLDRDHPTTVSRFEAQPLSADNKQRLAEATNALILGHTRTASGSGMAWWYGTAPITSVETGTREKPSGGDTQEKPKPPGTRDGGGGPRRRRNTVSYDNSNTQFAVLALHDAARGGVPIPKSVADAIAEHFLACTAVEPRVPAGKTVTGGGAPTRWGYQAHALGSPAMTFAGLSSLAIARDLGAKSSRIDAAIKSALDGVSSLMPQIVPGQPLHCDGYLAYSIEKAFDLLHVTQVDGHDWFAPLATAILDQQGEDGLWQDNVTQSSLFLLFLSRATVTASRVVDRRSTGQKPGLSGQGDVFLARTKSFVNAPDLVARFAVTPPAKAPTATEVEEAIRALAAEGHGRDACLLGPLGSLRRVTGARGERAAGWLTELTGTSVPAERATAAAAKLEELASAPTSVLRAVLRAGADGAELLPIRAFAATLLAGVPDADARDVFDAAEILASDPALATPAGERCARTYADALCALHCSGLPELERDKPISRDRLLAFVAEGRAQRRRALEAEISRALAAHAQRTDDPAAWKAARERLVALGAAGLDQLLAVAAEPSRAAAAFALLRATTGELIPDDLEAWRSFLRG